MVTVIDPNGTPAPIYMRSGTTIQTVAANGTTLAGATAIISLSGWSVVIVLTDDDPVAQAVSLPSDAQIGDVVELHASGQSFPIIYSPSGESIGTPGGGTTASLTLDSGGRGAILRKISSTIWRYLKSA